MKRECEPITKPVRERCKTHLAFVGEQPCCVCGRHPVHVHHLTHVQPKARGLRAGDQWTVGVCLTHHLAIHAHGREGDWWRSQGLDGIAIALGLWRASDAAGRVRRAAA